MRLLLAIYGGWTMSIARRVRRLTTRVRRGWQYTQTFRGIIGVSRR